MNNLKVKRASVIVIETNYIDMLVLRALLGKYINLCIVSNLNEALETIAEFNFDMLLLDIPSCNPEMINLKAIKTKSKNKDIKVCGSSNQYEETEFFMSKGFNDVLTKPVCKEDIFNTLNWQVIEKYNFLSGTPTLRTLSSVF